MQINLKYIHFNHFKHNGRHCRLSFFFTLALVERRNLSNSNYICDVINYLKKGFPLEWGICLQYSGICRSYREFPWANIPAMGIKRKKLRIGKKYSFHQPIRRQHSYIRWNYEKTYTFFLHITYAILYLVNYIL